MARRAADLLRRDRHELSLRLLANEEGMRHGAEALARPAVDPNARAREQIWTQIDYLADHLITRDDVFIELFIGEKLKQLYDGGLAPDEGFANRREVAEKDVDVLLGHLRRALGQPAADELAPALARARDALSTRGRNELRVLFIGDCLYLDVPSFLVPMAIQDGTSLWHHVATARNPADLRNSLRRLADQPFDLIFYSPFTYSFSMELSTTHRVRCALASARGLRGLGATVMGDVEKTLDLLTDLFEIPVYVHNTLNLRRYEPRWVDLARTIATARSRRVAREAINRRMAESVAARRAADANLVLLDETALLEKAGELALSRYLAYRPIQHPAEFGRAAAGVYRDVVAAHAGLVGKKVVVCDLDNTLWRGEIGEGRIQHELARQRVLKELRRKGVVLTVNSKNDPRNVRWDGAALGADDFVHMEINWDSKVANMRRTQQALNLKFKDFVFLDDRADQREMVQQAVPEILALDATAPRTWAQLERWAAALSDHPETDRTLQYRERERRASFLNEAARVEEDPTAQFVQLEIQMEIRTAKPTELKRVAELVNRTNQFNLAGSRTNLKELRQWQGAEGREVLVVEARDKFGPMGLVCAVLLEASGPEVSVPVFVLSCRVFGYGIENAVLNAVKRQARGPREGAGKAVRGAYVETPHNGPCRDLYPSHGFTREAGSWVLGPTAISSMDDPVWLAIIDGFSPRPLEAPAGPAVSV